MSYTVYIQKFKKGQEDYFKLPNLKKIIERYGKLEDTSYGLEIIPNIKELFENADLNGKSETEISNISIHRPSFEKILKDLIFDILEIEGTYFFDQELSYLISRHSNTENLPKELLENCNLTVVSSSEDILSKF